MIDTKRLATDAAYWDSVAPEGATHYCEESGKFGLVASAARHCCIPRPQSEWVDGLPPVGRECESATRGAGFRAGHITYVSDQILVWMDKLSGHDYAIRPHDREFRPIPTKAQRDRDELKSLLEDNIRGLYCYEDGKVRADVEDQVNAIISAGWTKP